MLSISGGGQVSALFSIISDLQSSRVQKKKYIFANNCLFCYVQRTLHIPVTGNVV